MREPAFTGTLKTYLEGIESEFSNIPAERVKSLETIQDYIAKSLEGNGTARLVFICTHNSRRSQLGQIWALTAAGYFGVEGIQAFSGGTESAAFNPRAVAALERAGFLVEKLSGNESNPVYMVRPGEEYPPSRMFSKKFTDPDNPGENFCAIMVCSDADKACPFVPGASKRISMPYEDPKEFDGTPIEESKYDERCREIARDLIFVFNALAGKE
jgi:protein-tyrosine-phosphatase